MAEHKELQRLMEGCKNGDQNFVKKNITNIKEIVDFNYVDAITKTNLLRSVCQCLGPEVLTSLLKQAGFLEKRDGMGRTLICMAIQKQQFQLVDCLIKNGAELNITDLCNTNLLKYAAHYGDILTAHTIVTIFTTHKLRHNQQYLLHLATKCKNLSQMNLLLTDIGKAINDKDRFGYTPLLFSCRFGNVETTNLLLENKAKLETCDRHGRNPLLMIIYRSRPYNDQYEVISQEELESLIKLVLANGLNIDDTDIHGWTALHYATLYQNLPIMRLLLGRKCDLNKQIANNFANFLADVVIPAKATAVYIAVAVDNTAAVELLCHAGADCNLETQTESSPLFKAVVNRSYVIAAMLHKHGAQIDMVSNIYYEKLMKVLIENSPTDNELIENSPKSENGDKMIDSTPTSENEGIELIENRPKNENERDERTESGPISPDKCDKLSFITSIIEQGLDVNKTDSAGNTFIQMMLNLQSTDHPYRSFHMDNLEKVIDIVTRHNIYNINHQNYKGETTVVSALKAIKELSPCLTEKEALMLISVVDKMVCKSNVNTQDDTGLAVVHYLLPALTMIFTERCICVNDEAVKQIQAVVGKCFALGARTELRDRDGHTAFHLYIRNPCSKSHPDVQQEIYEKFIVADDTDHSGVTVLHRLANRNPGVENLLPLFLSDPNQHSLGYINARYTKQTGLEEVKEGIWDKVTGLTALQICAFSFTGYPFDYRCCSTLPCLLRSGADIHVRYKQNEEEISVMKQVLTGVAESMRHLFYIDIGGQLYYILFVLMSAGAKFSRCDIQPQHRHVYNNLEVALSNKKECFQMLHRAILLGYKFDNWNLILRHEEFPDIESVPRLDVLSAQVIRWSLYPNAWYSAKKLTLPPAVYKEFFEDYQNTAKPEKSS